MATENLNLNLTDTIPCLRMSFKPESIWIFIKDFSKVYTVLDQEPELHFGLGTCFYSIE